jgi:sugar phosphate isomerase/epimerase
MQPQVSISTSFSYDIGVEQQLELVAEAGFSTISLGASQEHFGYLDPKERSQLKAALGQHGLVVDTVHATHRLDGLDAISKATATAEAAADFGAGCVVAHCGPFDCVTDGFDDRLGRLIDTCLAQAPVAESCGIVFALENVMPGPATDLVRKTLPELDAARFGLCYDSSHDQIDGPRPFDLLDEFRGRVFAVHLSDRVKPFVDHVVPGEGFIPWSQMCAKLQSACYAGPATMEVMMQHSRFREPKVFLREAYNASIRTWQLIHASND